MDTTAADHGVIICRGDRLVAPAETPSQPRRRSIRLPGYDYAQAGGYFLTLVTRHRECLFGRVVDGKVVSNEFGRAVEAEWLRTREIRREIMLDAFVIMPNHVHAIVFIAGDMDAAPAGETASSTPMVLTRTEATGRSPLRPQRPRGPAQRSVGAFVAGFKAAATARINALRGTPKAPVWQRNYHEHVVRNDDSLYLIRQYIADNPASWATDLENPSMRSVPLAASARWGHRDSD